MDRRHFMGLTAIGVAAAGMGMGCIPNGKKRIPKTHPQSALAEPNNIRSIWCYTTTKIFN